MNRFIAFCLASIGLAAAPVASATAHEAPASPAPTIVRINETIVVREHHHRRYRVERRRIRRHGHWVVVMRRIYY